MKKSEMHKWWIRKSINEDDENPQMKKWKSTNEENENPQMKKVINHKWRNRKSTNAENKNP